MNKLNYLLMLLAFLPFVNYAQVLPDGVTGTTQFINILKQNYNEENNYLQNLDTLNITAKIPVRLHIVKNMAGKPGIYPASAYNGISLANTYFKNIGIEFFIDSVNYVNDYNYSYITLNQNTRELVNLHAKANRINLFLVDSIKINDTRYYGFTYFPDEPDSNYIFLDKKYTSGNYLTTMLGHFMGLLSTHDNMGGYELANEKNCATSGDFICDTYADPNLQDQVDEECNYTGTQRDASGKYYVPSVANIMSNAPDNCKCIFTPQQYCRMYYYFIKYRQYLK